MEDIKISDLYSSGEISGKVYFWCVEHDFDTLQDILDADILSDKGHKYYDVFAGIVSEKSDNDIQLETESTPARLDFDELQSLMYKQGLSVRGTHALEALFLECGNSVEEIYRRITAQDFKVHKLKNVGRKTVAELEKAISLIKTTIENYARATSQNPQEKEPDLSGLESLSPLILAKAGNLSTRSGNVVRALFESCHTSVEKLYREVTSPSFSVYQLRNAGRKSFVELIEYFKWFVSLSDEFLSGEDSKVIEGTVSQYKLSDAGLLGDTLEIISVSDELGYFPVFTAIKCYLCQLSERDTIIVNGCLDIYQDQVLPSRVEVAKQAHITPERARQLRVKMFSSLEDYVSGLKDLAINMQKHSYTIAELPLVNQRERTNFNEDLIYWALSIIQSEDYVLLGDPSIAFANTWGNEEYKLNIASKRLSKLFDYRAFYEFFESVQSSKRYEDIHYNLNDIIPRYFTGRAYFESINDIAEECKAIINRSFGFSIFGNEVIAEKNADRNIPELAEIILRDIGHPMTIDEISREFAIRYPNKTSIALAGALRTNPNIKAVGRSSTYALAEWNEGTDRGGTIREFAVEYLMSLPLPIAKLQDIGEYVRQFRPTSSDKSINANLLLDQNDTFAVFYRKGERGNRYIGMAKYDFGEEYRKADPKIDAKRDFKTSCTLLESFVVDNGRLPFSNSVSEEEKRLCRFWNIYRRKLENGELSGEEKLIIESMYNRFAPLKINKKDYDWEQKFSAVKAALIQSSGLESLPDSLQEWFWMEARNYRYGRIAEHRKEQIEELLELRGQNVDRY